MALESLHEKIYLAEEEYLNSEITSEFKREYIDSYCRVDNADMNDFREEKRKND